MQTLSEQLLPFWRGAVFTAFDTETTGLKPEQENVIEIGAVKFDRAGIIARYNVLVNPQKPISSEITDVNGITNEMVAAQPPFAARARDFLRFIGGTVLVAHNAQFDQSFINAELARNALPPLQNTILDTLALSRIAFPAMGKYSLQFLAQNLGINVKNAHRAEDDARVCMELFRIIVEKTCPAPPPSEEAASQGV